MKTLSPPSALWEPVWAARVDWDVLRFDATNARFVRRNASDAVTTDSSSSRVRVSELVPISERELVPTFEQEPVLISEQELVSLPPVPNEFAPARDAARWRSDSVDCVPSPQRVLCLWPARFLRSAPVTQR